MKIRNFFFFVPTLFCRRATLTHSLDKLVEAFEQGLTQWMFRPLHKGQVFTQSRRSDWKNFGVSLRVL